MDKKEILKKPKKTKQKEVMLHSSYKVMGVKFFVTDENDLDNSKEIQINSQHKNNNDSLNKDSQNKIFNDFNGSIDLSHKNLVIYDLLTVSDKEINNRLYPDIHVQAMMKDKQLSSFYMKPILKNHNSDEDALGRFIDGNYIRHSDMQMFYGDELVPQVVIDEFKNRGAFNEGTGSNIGKAISHNLEFKARIIDGTYLSTSQGAYSESLICNICGKDYFGGECTHLRGKNYPIMSQDGNTILGYKKCIPETGPLQFIESSTVNIPANNTSTLLVYDTEKDRIVNMDNINEYSSIFDIKNIDLRNNNDSLEKPTIILNNKVQGLTDEEVKEKIKNINNIKDNLNEGVAMADVNNKPTEAEVNKDNNQSQGSVVAELKQLSNPFKDSALEIFIDKASESFGIEDEKAEEFFNKLSDEEIGVALKTLRFIDKNRKVEDKKEQNINNENKDTQENQANNTQENTNENQNQNKNSDELVNEVQALKDEIAKLKGINNEIPNNSTESNKDNKNSEKQSNNKYGFDF